MTLGERSHLNDYNIWKMEDYTLPQTPYKHVHTLCTTQTRTQALTCMYLFWGEIIKLTVELLNIFIV